MKFQENDERVKIIIYVSVALILQGILFCFIYYKSIDKVNDNLKKQNYLIVSYINKKDEDLTKDIIPIITGKNLGNSSDFSKGESILSKYSYNNNLKGTYNPIIGKVVYEYTIYFLLLALVILVIIIYGIIYLINPVFKEVKYLTYRAENIVENKIIEKEDDHKYKGSLDKFIIKFSLMEDRIHNSLDLLQQEKINLKNIINDISHQLKTPLMAISMYSDIIKDHREMNRIDVDNFINLMDEQLTRMDWLVKTLLKYARLECNVVEYNKQVFLLNNTIEESINPLRAKADEKNKKLIFIEYKKVYFNHDRKWLSEALSNIIKNAIEHTGVGGEIEIGVEETPITIRVWIKDNGCGIEESDIKKIFKRFHKGENSINPTSIGIGLCLSEFIVKAHNGSITVESEVGKGSTFYINFIKSI